LSRHGRDSIAAQIDRENVLERGVGGDWQETTRAATHFRAPRVLSEAKFYVREIKARKAASLQALSPTYANPEKRACKFPQGG